jgi:N-acyl-D-amino-acid deacylase
MLDLKITNAMIVDGTGRPAYFGDVGVEGGKLRAIGDVWDGAAEVIDADGRVVAPGFIDLHTHYDAQLRWDPVTPSCWHGVTTAIVGNCGYGVAPCRPADRRSLAELLARAEGMSLAALDPDGWSWITQAEYLRTLAGPGQLGINVGSLVPHSAVRTFVMGEAALERAATAEEIAAMKQLVADGMRAGAFGFSSSQVREHFGPGGRPVPSRQATLGEIKTLAQICWSTSGC